MKVYTYKKSRKVFLLVLLPILIVIFLYSYFIQETKATLISFGAIICTIYALIFIKNMQIIIDDKEMSFNIRLFGKKFYCKDINFSDVEIINDDRLVCFHVFHIGMKDRKLRSRVMVNSHFDNYKEMLRDILFRCSPSTVVDEATLKIAKCNPREVGKFYK